jgi:Right handed beta helix region
MHGARKILYRLRGLLDWIPKWLFSRRRPRSWQTGCLSTGIFTPPNEIPTPVPPPVDWPWIPGLWEEFPGTGKPPNVGPPGWNDPRSKHVDRSHPAAADVPGGGSFNAPWATIQYALDQLNPGDGLYIHRPSDPNPARVGLYEEHLFIDARQGSPWNPFWVIAVPGVRVQDLKSTRPGLHIRKSSYWVFQDFELDGGGANARRNPATGKIDLVTGISIDHSSAAVIHSCYVHGWTHAGVSLVESDSCIVSTCRVMDNVQEEGQDCHGMQVLWGCRDTLVWKNTTHGNSGDGIQLQQGHEDSLLPGQKPTLPPGAAPHNTTILKNHFTGDFENGVDLKNCLRVGVQQNDFDGYQGSTAIVVHCSPDEIVIERNVIHNSGNALSVGAWNGRVGQLSFRFNAVYGLTAQPAKKIEGTAVRVSHTRRADIYHNTMYDLDRARGSGILLADIAIDDTPADRQPQDAGVDAAAVFNNIVVGARTGLWYVLPKPQPAGAIGVLNLLSDYNVLYSCGQAIVAAGNVQLPKWIHAGLQYDCETRTTDPGLRDPAAGDFTPTTQEALDRAARLTYSPTWQRICGNGPDIGAIEVCP